MTGERGLITVFFADGHLPETRVTAHRREELGIDQGVDTLVHPGEWVGVLDGNRVQLSVVHTESPLSVRLGNNDDCRSSLARRRFDEILLQHDVDFFRLQLSTSWACTTRLAVSGLGVVFELDSVLG